MPDVTFTVDGKKLTAPAGTLLIEACRKAGVVLALGYQRRRESQFRWIRQQIDAGLFGTKLTPDDAFRFARGDEVVSTTGVPAKLRRPLDFLVVTDHSNYLGLPFAPAEKALG